MYTPCLLLVSLILSAFFPITQQHRGDAPMRGATIVERLRSELLSVLDNEALAPEDVSRPARSLEPYLTRVGAESSAEVYSATRAIEKPDGLPAPRSTLRRGSGCWWLWVLFGDELCGRSARLPRLPFES
jgi:hypothetical protein